MPAEADAVNVEDPGALLALSAALSYVASMPAELGQDGTRGRIPSSAIRALIEFARPYRRKFLLIALLSAIATGLSLLEPLVYRMAINDVAGVFVYHTHKQVQDPGAVGPDTGQLHTRTHVAPRTSSQAFKTLLVAVVLLFLINVSSQFFEGLSDNVSIAAANYMERDLIRATFSHVLHLPLSFFGKRATGALTKQIDQSDQVEPIVTAVSKELAPEVFRLVGAVAIMATQSIELTLLALVTMPPYFWVAYRSSKRLESDLPRYYELWEEVSARIQQAISGVKTVKLSGAEDRETKRLAGATEAAYSTYLGRNRLANRYAFVEVGLTQLSMALVLGFGGWKVMQNQLTPGDVVMFVAYLERLFDPIDNLFSLQATIQQQLVSLQRALRLLASGESEPSGGALQPGPGAVDFRDVRFSYDGEREVICGATFRLEAGKFTALVGPSGAGKTTLVDLLLRLYQPTSGEILMDGQLLSAVDPAAVRREVAVVSPDGAIFRGTILDNIRYRRADATEEEVAVAAEAAGLGPALQRLPNGLKTEVGEGGVGLSVGERQRVQLARTMVSRPRVLVLDEATANLDYATEMSVKETLRELRGQCTVLAIAHRYSMVNDADHVVVLEEGRVIEAGTPEGLMASGGWFAQLAQAASGPLVEELAAEMETDENEQLADEDEEGEAEEDSRGHLENDADEEEDLGDETEDEEDDETDGNGQ